MILTVHFLGANIPLAFSVGENSVEKVANMVLYGKSGSFRNDKGDQIFINIDHVLYMQYS